MLIKILCLLSSVIFLSSCLKQTESITPLAPVQTLSEAQKESMWDAANSAGNAELSQGTTAKVTPGKDPGIFYLNLKYNINNIDVFEAANMPNVFEQVAHTFLAGMAKLVLSIDGSQQIKLPPMEFKIPDMNIDLTMVKSIKIKSIFLQYSKEVDTQNDYAANFAFIDTLELAQEINIPNVGKVDSLLISYKKSNNKCLLKCIQFDVLSDNVLYLLKPNSTLKLKPQLTIASFPAVSDLKLDGVVEMQIGLKLPF